VLALFKWCVILEKGDLRGQTTCVKPFTPLTLLAQRRQPRVVVIGCTRDTTALLPVLSGRKFLHRS